MTRLFAFALVAGGVAVVSAMAPQASEADCIAVIKWGGGEYVGRESPEGKLALGGRLGRARVPACIDTSPAPSDVRDTFARVRRIAGVQPAVAIFNIRDRSVYTAPGYFLAHPSHALHDLYSRESFFPAGLSIRRCGQSRSVRGRVAGGLTGLRLRTRSGHALGVEVSPGTRFRGFLRHGLPYLQAGDRVKVVGRTCVLRLGGRLFVARRIGPAS